MGWVVRAGIAVPPTLKAGYRKHRQMPHVWGFSVQYDMSASVNELARAGQFSNKQISYQEEAVLAMVLASLGYTMRLVKSPGIGYHHTFVVLYDASGVMLQALPDDAAAALDRALIRIMNPHPTPYSSSGGNP